MMTKCPQCGEFTYITETKKCIHCGYEPDEKVEERLRLAAHNAKKTAFSYVVPALLGVISFAVFAFAVIALITGTAHPELFQALVIVFGISAVIISMCIVFIAHWNRSNMDSQYNEVMRAHSKSEHDSSLIMLYRLLNSYHRELNEEINYLQKEDPDNDAFDCVKERNRIIEMKKSIEKQILDLE